MNNCYLYPESKSLKHFAFNIINSKSPVDRVKCKIQAYFQIAKSAARLRFGVRDIAYALTASIVFFCLAVREESSCQFIVGASKIVFAQN